MMTERLLGNRYELEALIGQGGMAHVYRARDRVLGRPVAVKVLRSEYASDEKLLARFQREARAAANLLHPNIVSVYDVGQDGDRHYIVMEYMAGPTLVFPVPLPNGYFVSLRKRYQILADQFFQFTYRLGSFHGIRPCCKSRMSIPCRQLLS